MAEASVHGSIHSVFWKDVSTSSLPFIKQKQERIMGIPGQWDHG